MDGAPAEKNVKNASFFYFAQARGEGGAGRGERGERSGLCKKRHKKVREILRSPKSFLRRPAEILLQDRGAHPVRPVFE